MKIWTIKEGEPLPIPECPGRQMRCGILSEMLADRGHDVTWWTSDFFHQTKKRLRDQETVIDLSDHCRLHMLHAKTVYSKNVSLERIRYSRQLGKEFRRAARQAEKPDVIICAYPLIDLAYEAVSYGKEFHVPVIVDIRDLWPDSIWERFPEPLRFVVKIGCASLQRKASYAIQKADAVIGVIPKCMDFAASYGRKMADYDGVYYLAYHKLGFSLEEMEAAKRFWQEQGLSEGDFILCWMGQISTQRTDFSIVADVVAENTQVKFIICGDGPSRIELEQKYKNNSNILFPGFLDHVYLNRLMELSSVGIIPIRNSPDFIDTINNKAIEYMAGSLCIGTTLSGLLKKLVQENGMGFYFETGEELKSIIAELMANPQLLNEYKTNAKKYYEAHFKSEDVYGKLCDLIEVIGA